MKENDVGSVQIPILPAKATIFRKLVVFNDESAGENLQLIPFPIEYLAARGVQSVAGVYDRRRPEKARWQKATVIDRRYRPNRSLPNTSPLAAGFFILRTEKEGVARFEEDKIVSGPRRTQDDRI